MFQIKPKENFRWVAGGNQGYVKNNIIRYEDVKDLMECTGNLGCWYPQNYKFPLYYRVPYHQRFTYADNMWEKNDDHRHPLSKDLNNFIY